MHNTFALDRLVGESAWTLRTRREILQAASGSQSVLITGPAGSGKQLIARAIHAHGSGGAGPFIPFRCDQVPPSLRAAQLFGHAAGTISLSPNAALGCVRAARGGTLYLDEVAHLDAACQERLLAILRADSAAAAQTAAPPAPAQRVIASSSIDLHLEVQRGRFRLDLLYELNRTALTTMELKQRREDIPPLVRHLIARTTLEHGLPLKQLSAPAMALLQAWDWPGNVDELQQQVERAVVYRDELVLGPDAFPEILDALAAPARPAPTTQAAPAERVNTHESVPCFPVVAAPWPTLADVEAEHLRTTMQQVHYNLQAAAQLLGLDPAALQEKLARRGILSVSPPLRQAQSP